MLMTALLFETIFDISEYFIFDDNADFYTHLFMLNIAAD